MNSPDDADDKQFEPTPKKLEDARKKGEIPRSADLTNAAAYGGFVLVALSLGGLLMTELGSSLAGLLSGAPELAQDIFSGGAQARVSSILGDAALLVSPWLIGPAILALLAIFAQKSFVFVPSKLQPKINRISVLANAKNKFGRQGLFEFAKSLTKLLVYATVLAMFLVGRTPEIIQTVRLEPSIAAATMVSTALAFIIIVLLVAAAIGTLDFLWQHAEHIRKNRMSRKELMDETKDMEGDPHMKQQRRQKGHDIAMNKMLADVPKADVVIVNPNHFAVALKWTRAPGSAPVCVAKGVDEIAARIRESANEYGIPVRRDAPTARALFATVEIGDQILPEHFRAVAAAIRFAENMATQSKSAGWKS
jgi:flagellar biosynthetic protein FlhB